MTYFDSDGNECSLDTLCRREPAWAANRIRSEIEKVERLRRERDEDVADLERLEALVAEKNERLAEADTEVERLREAMEAMERWCPKDAEGMWMINGGIYVVGEGPQIAAVTATPEDCRPAVDTLAIHQAHQGHLGECRGYWHTEVMRRASRADIETIVQEMHPDDLEEQLRLTAEIDTRRLSALYAAGALGDDRTLVVAEKNERLAEADTEVERLRAKVKAHEQACLIGWGCPRQQEPERLRDILCRWVWVWETSSSTDLDDRLSELCKETHDALEGGDR